MVLELSRPTAGRTIRRPWQTNSLRFGKQKQLILSSHLAIHLDSGTPKGLWFDGLRGDYCSMIDLYRWFYSDSLLTQAVEQFSSAARPTPVEAERELLQVEIKMLRTHGSLMGA
jgi:hypothetical protein